MTQRTEPPGPPGTRRVLAEAVAQLAPAGVPSPEHDAAELLAHVLGCSRTALVLHREVSPPERQRFDELVARRAAREPLQHLVGVAWFRHVELSVGPGVFVPRPETELLAGWGIARAQEVLAAGRTPVVADLGTGSGAIALSVAEEVSEVVVHAVELDPAAYAWAERNLRGTGVDLRQGDFAEACPDLAGMVDVVLCNPPYIPLDAWESVDAEARDHDPPAALWSGNDGLDALRALQRTGAHLLRTGGWLGAEHADVQGDSARALFAGAGRWVQVSDHSDLAGRARFVTARLGG